MDVQDVYLRFRSCLLQNFGGDALRAFVLACDDGESMSHSAWRSLFNLKGDGVVCMGLDDKQFAVKDRKLLKQQMCGSKTMEIKWTRFVSFVESGKAGAPVGICNGQVVGCEALHVLCESGGVACECVRCVGPRTMAWAFATVNLSDSKLFMSFARAAEWLVNEFNA